MSKYVKVFMSIAVVLSFCVLCIGFATLQEDLTVEGDLAYHHQEVVLLSGKEFNDVIRAVFGTETITSEGGFTYDPPLEVPLVKEIKFAVVEGYKSGDSFDGYTYRRDIKVDVNGIAEVFTDDTNKRILIVSDRTIYANPDCSTMFGDMRYLTTLDFDNINGNRDSFNTSRVTNMKRMFFDCKGLPNLDITSFVTDHVTDMSHMFGDCQALTGLNLSNFNTSEVTTMAYMFKSCNKINSLDLSKFNTEKVTDMSYMFYNCWVLSSLDKSTFITNRVTDMSYMFCGCKTLPTIELSKNFKTTLVSNMSCMFYDCHALKELDLSGFDTTNVTDMYQMFFNCETLTHLNLSKFVTTNVTNMVRMFSGCKALQTLTFSNSFKTGRVTNMSEMFYLCQALTSLDVSMFDTSNVTNMSHMFQYCKSLTKLDLANFSTPMVTDMSYMFSDCINLILLDVSSFNTASVTNMSHMFYAISSDNNIAYTVACTIYGGNWNTQNVTDDTNMFAGCWHLKGGRNTWWREHQSFVTKQYARIDGGPTSATPGYFTAKTA